MANYFTILTGFLGLFLAEQGAHALSIDQLDARLRERAASEEVLLNASTAVTNGVFEQKLDPTNPRDRRTFQQRYFIDSSAADSSDSPVLYYICGESPCSAMDLEMGAIADHAQALHAHRVALEHRYYGQSQPFSELTTDHLRFLKMDYAVEDLAAFQKYAMKNLGLRGKWIAMGGSYSGALSAFYRLKHPELVVGSLASSAPVLPKADFLEYDHFVAEQVGPECGQLMRKAVAELEDSMSRPDDLAKVEALFGLHNVSNPVDFLYVVADMGAAAVQYGMKDDFCGALTDDGDLLNSYASAGQSVFNELGMTPDEDSFESAVSLDTNANSHSFQLRQWMYQSCTEFGFYQIAYPDRAQSVRSSLISLEYHNQVCKRLFGLDAPVDTTHVKNDFYRPLLNPQTTSILFTNGSSDPWSSLSLSHATGNDGNSNLAYDTIDGAAHCEDLGMGSSSAVTQARDLFLKLAAGWLAR